MTIKDLIAELSRYPEDAEVIMVASERYEPDGRFTYENGGTGAKCLVIHTEGDDYCDC